MEEKWNTVSGKRGGKQLFVCQTNAMTLLLGKLSRDLWESCLYNLLGSVQESGI